MFEYRRPRLRIGRIAHQENRMYAALRQWRIDPTRSEEATRKVKEGFIPELRKIEGFVSYDLVEDKEGGAFTVSVFEDRKGIEESTRLAKDFAGRELEGVILGPPRIIEGEVAVHETAGRERTAEATGR